MRVVVDLGCKTHGEDESLTVLAERFRPDIIYGFDPLLDASESTEVAGVEAALWNQAAWIYDGEVDLAVGSTAGDIDATVAQAKNGRGEWTETRTVECFNFAVWLASYAESDEIVAVKMDVEGAEFPLIAALVASGCDAHIGLLLVEWHDEKMGADFTLFRQELVGKLRCPVEEW